ncbi:MAG: ATP-binding protein, partial [Phormidesmis sp.]
MPELPLVKRQSPQRIVLAARLGANEQALREVLETQAQVQVDEPTVAAVAEAIRTEATLVVLTEEVLTGELLGKQLGEHLTQQPEWSDIPVIILLKECQRFGDCLALLGQTTHHRSVLLLELPLKRELFAAIVRSCLMNRARQYWLRDTLHQLHESNQALENFSYTAAHELRSPLGIVKSAFDLLIRTSLAPKQQKLAEMGQQTVQGMNKLLDALLSYSKVQSQATDFTSVDLDAVVREAIAGLGTLINQKGADVTWQTLPQVHGSRQLLVQLISNLVKNAIIHNDTEAPTVKIWAALEPSKDEPTEVVGAIAVSKTQHFYLPRAEGSKRWIISISDNGPGVAPEAQQKIFAMFNRAGKSRAEGSGIGLALCRRVAEQHQST